MHMDGADPDWGSVVLGMHMGGGEVDPYWSNVSLLMLMNGTNGSTAIGDVTGKTVTVAGNAAISTTQSKFGGSSCYFDGTGDYLSLASSSDFAFGSGDFTVEFWVRLDTTTGTDTFVDFRPSVNGAYAIIAQTDGTLNYDVNNTNPIAAAGALSAGVWSHIAASRQGTTLRLFVNGALVGSAIDSTVYLSAPLLIGKNIFSTALNLGGYLDNLRITKGVARYTADFTPPREPFSLT